MIACPCCDRPTSDSGVEINAIASARARALEARERFQKIPAKDEARLWAAHDELKRVEAELESLLAARNT